MELGGTKVLVTVGEGPHGHAPPVRLATGAPEATLGAVVAALHRLRDEVGPFEAVGVAGFGPVELDPASPRHGHLLKTPKPGWEGADLLGPIRRAFDLPTALETDVNAAAVAEGLWGAAEGLDDHAYVTVGTGVGVGLVVGGRPVHGAGHPEAGHLRVRDAPGDDFPGACPWHGRCVEGLVSGFALEARLGAPGADIPADHPVWAFCGDYLGQLFAALVLTAAPRRIVVGGGVGLRPELLEAARAGLLAALNGYLERVSTPEQARDLVTPARLENAGLMGALHLAAVAAGRAGHGSLP